MREQGERGPHFGAVVKVTPASRAEANQGRAGMLLFHPAKDLPATAPKTI